MPHSLKGNVMHQYQKGMKRLMTSAAAVALCFGGAVSANAQSNNDSVLDEIIVSAERRVQNSQDVPIAATILTAEDLVRKGVDNVSDIQQVAPSVAISSVGRSTFINIRGVGIAQTAPTSVPGVAFYLDGQSIPHEMLISQAFYDLAAIEVLRGPQGTLTGQNSTGGAVYVTTPKPEFDDSYTSFDLTAGTYGKFRGVIASNIALSDNIALRAAYVHDQVDSYTENLGTGDDVGGHDLDAFRLNIAMRTDDDRFSLNLRGEHFDNKTGNEVIKLRDDANTNPFEVSQDSESYLDYDGYRISAEPRLAISDNVEARVLLSYQDARMDDANDGDRTSTAAPIPAGLPASRGNRSQYLGRVGVNFNEFKTFLAEVNFLSTGDGPLNWVVGGFYMDDSIRVGLQRDHHNADVFKQVDSDIQLLTENSALSAFGQVNWFVQENLELIIGGRYSEDQQDFTRFKIPGPPQDPFTTTQESNELTGKIGANYFVNDDAMVYGTVSKGYKAGGVNLLPQTGFFEPETNVVYELGMKSELMDRTVRINANVYYSDYEGIQLTSRLGGFPFVQNAGSLKNKGFEIEGLANVGQMQFNFGLGYLDAEFGEAVCLNNSFSTGPDDRCDGSDELVEEGTVAPYSPKWTINAGVDYEIDMGNDRTVTPRIQMAYISDQQSTPFDSANSYIGGRTIVDARIRLGLQNGVSVEAFVDNLFDETYVASQRANSTSATGGYIYGAPRTFGVRTRFVLGQ